jgi:hypothetical protein
MTRQPPSPLAISVRQRLLNYSKQHKRDFQEVLRQYAQERLLARLSHPALQEAGFILKGALLCCESLVEAPRPRLPDGRLLVLRIAGTCCLDFRCAPWEGGLNT